MHGCFIFQCPTVKKPPQKKESVRGGEKKPSYYLILVKINVYLPNHNPSHALFGDFPLYCKASKPNLENNDFIIHVSTVL